ALGLHAEGGSGVVHQAELQPLAEDALDLEVVGVTAGQGEVGARGVLGPLVDEEEADQQGQTPELAEPGIPARPGGIEGGHALAPATAACGDAGMAAAPCGARPATVSRNMERIQAFDQQATLV